MVTLTTRDKRLMFVTAILYNTSFAFLIAYHLLRYKFMSWHPSLRKRHPEYVVFMNILAIYYMLVSGPWRLYNVLFSPSQLFISFYELSKFTTTIIVFSYLARLWIILFRMNYMIAIGNGQWTQLINKDHITHNWYIMNRELRDSLSVFFRAVVLPYAFFGVCSRRGNAFFGGASSVRKRQRCNSLGSLPLSNALFTVFVWVVWLIEGQRWPFPFFTTPTVQVFTHSFVLPPSHVYDSTHRKPGEVRNGYYYVVGFL